MSPTETAGTTTGGRHRRGRRGLRLAVVGPGILAATLLAGGVAGAAWSSSGTGSSRSQATTALPPVVRGAAVTTGLLFPTGTGDAAITVTNPNPYAVRVVQVAGAGSVTAAGGTGTCTTTGVTFTTQAPTPTRIAAGDSAPLVLAGAVAMSNATDPGCQNAVFTVPVTVTVESVA